MAKFQFPFENVLNHRRLLEGLAQKDLHEAQAVLNHEIEVLNQMQDERHQAFVTRYQRQVQGGSAGESLTQVHEYLRGQDLRIERQRQKIQDIEKQVEAFREVLRAKAIDTKIIEGLKERKKDEFRLEQKKLEQKRADDMTSARFKLPRRNA